jgi:hypothetical protein
MRGSLLCMGSLQRIAGVLFLAATGCVDKAPAPKAVEPTTAPGAVIESERFTVPLPSGYTDVTAEFGATAPGLSVVLRANESNRGYQPTIVVRKAPLPGGTFADPATCARTGAGIVAGGSLDPGTGGTLLRATIIDGPVGETCQIHVRAPEGSARGGTAIALITELNQPGNTRQNPKETWLMTCNHADGDAGAEAICRKTLAGFRFRGH